LMVTAITTLDMAAECRRPTQFNRAHHATLCGAQRGAVILSIGFAVAAEHIRHFRPRAGHQTRAQKCLGGVGGGSIGAG
jgi:hypothetical protein